MPHILLPAGQAHVFVEPQRLIQVSVNEQGSTNRVTFTIVFEDDTEQDVQSGYGGATMNDSHFNQKEVDGVVFRITRVINDSHKALEVEWT